MRIGILRKRLELQRESLESSGVVMWTTLATVWGDVRPVPNPSVMSGNYDRRATHIIRVRFRDGVDTGMRLVDGSHVYSIKHLVNVEERDRWLDLHVEEGGTLE